MPKPTVIQANTLRMIAFNCVLSKGFSGGALFAGSAYPFFFLVTLMLLPLAPLPNDNACFLEFP